jgi:hypothetical protein
MQVEAPHWRPERRATWLRPPGRAAVAGGGVAVRDMWTQGVIVSRVGLLSAVSYGREAWPRAQARGCMAAAAAPPAPRSQAGPRRRIIVGGLVLAVGIIGAVLASRDWSALGPAEQSGRIL